MLSCAFITTCIITTDPITANATAIVIPTMVLLLFFFGGGGGDEPELLKFIDISLLYCDK